MEGADQASKAVKNSGTGLLEVAAFLLGLFVAWHFEWTTTDLVWSLWLSSLFTGYATILATIGAGLYFACRLMCHEKFIRSQTPVFLLIVFCVASFVLAFFSLHFCGFHAAHGAILSAFFPPPGVKGHVFGDAFVNPPKLLYLAWSNLFPHYGLFLLSTFAAESPKIFLPFFKVHRLIKEGEAMEAAGREPARMKKGALPDPFAAPYKNVVKTHCLLFFFALAHVAGLYSFLVFAVAYSVYFFPELALNVVRRVISGSQKPSADGA